MDNSADRQAFTNLPLTQLQFYLSEGGSISCHRCGFSPRQAVNGGDKKPLQADKIIQAVREAVPLGLRTVQFIGSSTLRHPDFDKLLDWLENLELGMLIETNGGGLTPERADRLARLPQCKVSIGLDGATSTIHDSIRQSPGEFETAIEAVRLLSKAGRPPEIVFCVQRRNASQAAELIRVAEKAGARSVRFSLRQPWVNQVSKLDNHASPCLERDDEALAVEELIALGRRIERDLVKTTRLHLLFDQPPAFRGLQPMARVEGQGRCDILNTLGVLNSGEYAMCGGAENIPDLIYGPVGLIPLEQIWNKHPTLLALRNGMPDQLQGVCGHCVMKSACLGNCAAENYLRGGTFWGPNWFCESAQQAGLFPAGRIIENCW